MSEPEAGLLDLNTKIDLEELGEKIDDVFEAIPIPDICTYVTIALDEFAGTTIGNILNEISKQPKNCREYSRWITAVSILIAYVSTKLYAEQ